MQRVRCQVEWIDGEEAVVGASHEFGKGDRDRVSSDAGMCIASCVERTFVHPWEVAAHLVISLHTSVAAPDCPNGVALTDQLLEAAIALLVGAEQMRKAQ